MLTWKRKQVAWTCERARNISRGWQSSEEDIINKTNKTYCNDKNNNYKTEASDNNKIKLKEQHLQHGLYSTVDSTRGGTHPTPSSSIISDEPSKLLFKLAVSVMETSSK